MMVGAFVGCNGGLGIRPLTGTVGIRTWRSDGCDARVPITESRDYHRRPAVRRLDDVYERGRNDCTQLILQLELEGGDFRQCSSLRVVSEIGVFARSLRRGAEEPERQE